MSFLAHMDQPSILPYKSPIEDVARGERRRTSLAEEAKPSSESHPTEIAISTSSPIFGRNARLRPKRIAIYQPGTLSPLVFFEWSKAMLDQFETAYFQKQRILSTEDEKIKTIYTQLSLLNTIFPPSMNLENIRLIYKEFQSLVDKKPSKILPEIMNIEVQEEFKLPRVPSSGRQEFSLDEDVLMEGIDPEFRFHDANIKSGSWS